jgi:hypothetical protein
MLRFRAARQAREEPFRPILRNQSVDDAIDTKLYRQMQATKSAALRIGPLHPNRRDAAFIRYQHFVRLWSREDGADDGVAD